MEPGLLLLLLLAAPWGQGWAASEEEAEEVARADPRRARPEEPGKCHETRPDPCDNICFPTCPGSTGCGQECQQGKDFHLQIDLDLTTNCVNRCRDDSSCRGRRKCCWIRCQFCRPQPVPAGQDTLPTKKVPHTCCCCNSTCSSDTGCPNCLRCWLSPRRSSRFGVAVILGNLGFQQYSYPTWLCNLPADKGPCTNTVYRYTFNRSKGSCQLFKYGGCKGNANNFLTLKECQRVCHRGLKRQ